MNKYQRQTEAYRIIVSDLNKPKPLTHPGEDIRCAKAIFEDRFGEQSWNDVNLWLFFAREVRDYLGTKTIQEAADKLEIKYRKL
jgi:hypothetical protein